MTTIGADSGGTIGAVQSTAVADDDSLITVVGNVPTTGGSGQFGIFVSGSTPVVSAAGTFSDTFFFGTDSNNNPVVPVTECSARFREGISGSGEVPVVECVGQFGGFVTGTAPVIEGAATLNAAYAGYITVVGNTPTTHSTGSFGFSVTGKVPTVTGFVTLCNNLLTVSGYTPVVSGTATIPMVGITVTGKTPVVTAALTLHCADVIIVNGATPVSKGVVAVAEVELVEVFGYTPVVLAEYSEITLNGNFIIVDGTVPVIIANSSTGISAAESRFTDVILQYSRWE